MPLPVKAGETIAARRRVVFHLVGTDGITPANGEAGGQPEISIDGASFTDEGIGVLTLTGNGRYYADLDEDTIDTVGKKIETRYKSNNTAECPGDVVIVVEYDPYTDISHMKAKIDSITLTAVTISSPVASDGTTVTVEHGDDYNSAENRAIIWNFSGQPDLTDATGIKMITDKGIEINVTKVTTGSGVQTVKAEPTYIETLSLKDSSFYRVRATLLSGRKVSVLKGELKVSIV